ncbi:MAG: YlxM family DNA-binding protein [Lactobacillus sp.]
MDRLTKSEQLGDLYAYYRVLLTPGQQRYFEAYYYDDLSLGEIAANHQVSRQAVYDNLKRSSESLVKYEAKLHLCANDDRLEQQLLAVLASLSQQDLPAAQHQLQIILNQIRGVSG